MKKVILPFVLILSLFFLPSIAWAKIGVGVGTGKIVVDEQLKPGTIYSLPSLNVLNTGDEPSDYAVGVSYHEKQPELRPKESWFMFSPQKFHLEPGEMQEVSVKLNLPVMTEPGKYFAYVEGYPLAKAQSGETSIGIAAAAKLYFTVVPGNFFEGVYYKFLSFWNVYAPWPQWVSMGLAVGVLVVLFKRFFHLEINRKRPAKKTQETKDE